MFLLLFQYFCMSLSPLSKENKSSKTTHQASSHLPQKHQNMSCKLYLCMCSRLDSADLTSLIKSFSFPEMHLETVSLGKRQEDINHACSCAELRSVRVRVRIYDLRVCVCGNMNYACSCAGICTVRVRVQYYVLCVFVCKIILPFLYCIYCVYKG